MDSSRALVIFARYPMLGMGKTRLAAGLGDEATLQLYEAMLGDTAWTGGRVARCRCLAALTGLPGEISAPRDPLGRDPFARYALSEQQGDDFGTRLGAAMELAVAESGGPALLLGADSPEISDSVLELAFVSLEERDVVIGPASDGGYYLIGMRVYHPSLFQDINWSTETVAAETEAAAHALGLTTTRLETLSDLDYLEDLRNLAARRRSAWADAGVPSPCPATDGWLRGELPGQGGVPPTLGEGGEQMSEVNEIPDRIQEALNHTVAIIPVWNEEEGIGDVLADIPRGVTPIVVDNGSTDGTIPIVEATGAILIHETKRGYGNVCMAGIRAIPEKAPQTRYVVFIDGDHADHPEDLPDMMRYLVDDEADMVLASRISGVREPGALPLQSRFAIWYARRLLLRLYFVRFTDIGPFRVMPLEVLHRLNMVDPTWGWTVEMQAKGARLRLRMKEVPGRYRKRPGDSKISGAFWTAIKTGLKMLYVVLKWRFKRLKPPAGEVSK